MSQVTTITFFKFKTIRNKFWALSMMQLAQSRLKDTEGQSFYKLMGSGRGLGFSAFPDWTCYVLLQVWANETAAQFFLDNSTIMQDYRKRTTEVWSVYLKNSAAHGQWNRSNPFEVEKLLPKVEVVVVLTRATIKWHKIISFWRYVPTSHRSLNENQGIIYTKGVGELPVIQMATLSIWKDEESLKNFAYRSKEHIEAIAMTRRLRWYKEELFARFKPYKSVGSWEGRNPLAEFLK
jgi:hypothetical protein